MVEALAGWLRDEGYADAKCISRRHINLFHEKIGHRVFLHLDGQFLVLEQPHEMGCTARTPKEHFELWVDLTDPDSLPTMLRFLSEITSWGDSPRKSKT